MPYPDKDQLSSILRSHFNRIDEEFWTSHKAQLDELFKDFEKKENRERHDRATDQLLNFIHLFTEDPKFRPSDKELLQLKEILFKSLGSEEGK